MRFLVDFIGELREVGIGVSMVEAVDAAAALDHIDLLDRDQVRATLAATLIKSSRHLEAFDTAFDGFFATRPRPFDDPELEGVEASAGGAGASAGEGGIGGGGAEDNTDLMEALFRAVGAADEDLLQAVVRAAVRRFGGMESGRPVGGAYYAYRVARGLDLDALRSRLEAAGESDNESTLDRRLRLQEVGRVVDRLRDMIRREITRRLVTDRGHLPVAKTMRRPLAEDIDLTTATRDDLQRMERAVQPLTRKLAARVARRRRSGLEGRLDVRRTVRRSLSTGGVLAEPRFRKPRPGRPDILVLADVSGSVATFARFTMQLVHAVSSQLRRVRAFAFIDAIDEVTGHFRPGTDLAAAMARVGSEARVVWVDGHSNYGHAFAQFVEQHLSAVTPTTTVIITGDARTNYHEPHTEALATIASRARAVYWLNPEDRRYWDTGDSVIGLYAPLCEAVYEVRNLRQLERFVETISVLRRDPARVVS
jgi:uncharacterized protein with von Willebrand factor type A (vWA) domain